MKTLLKAGLIAATVLLASCSTMDATSNTTAQAAKPVCHEGCKPGSMGHEKCMQDKECKKDCKKACKKSCKKHHKHHMHKAKAAEPAAAAPAKDAAPAATPDANQSGS